jgi:predicted O-methyltransferase YrrM
VGWPSKKSILLQVIGRRRFGALSYALWPGRRFTWGGPFNGQACRCLLFAALVERLRPVAIVETGTFLGTTTEWMAGFQVPVITCENSAECFGFARARLRPLRNVTITLGDSREFLRGLPQDKRFDASNATILFYLDAHWNADLPLAAEIDIVFNSCPKAAVLMDDFEVPGDPGYDFDSYGPDLALNASYIDTAVRNHGLETFYPSTPSSTETGMRRGCVVLCKDEGVVEALRGISLLRSPVGTTALALANHHALPGAR